jgi:hypothetical protein
MTTAWTAPTIFSQYAEEGAESVHVQWDDSLTSTYGCLEHIARSPKHDLRTKTYYLKATGFNFQNLPQSVSGIELRLSMKRRGRITDETISLVFDGETSENRATLDLAPTKLYGGETDNWSVGNLSLANLNSNFGVLLRFQAHPHWPHKDAAFIDAVELRIH